MTAHITLDPHADALPFHPFAEIFPLLEGADFDELVANVARGGVRERILLHDGMVLDGRNRYRAARAAGRAIQAELFRGDDPLDLVVALNLHRRHLNEAQRALVAARLSNLSHGRHARDEAQICVSRAAELLNVSPRSVDHGRVVRDRGVPELARAVERGAIAITTAADVARLPTTEQREIVAIGRPAIMAAAKRYRTEQAVIRHGERVEKLAAISAGNLPLAGLRRYPIIYMDPPWRTVTWSEVTGSSRAVENHYPTMPLDEIQALPVANLATSDALCLLWARGPLLPECIVTLQGYGFRYVSNWIWNKDQPGTGYWGREKHEQLLIGTRGAFPAPLPGTQPASVLDAPRGEPSHKPDLFLDLIDRLWPSLPKIELFGRQGLPGRTRRAGWDVWGNQSGAEMAEATA